jgi:hypothetical protein
MICCRRSFTERGRNYFSFADGLAAARPPSPACWRGWGPSILALNYQPTDELMPNSHELIAFRNLLLTLALEETRQRWEST